MNVLLAAVLLLELPLGPGSERVARQLAAPHQHAAPIAATGWHLWDIRVQPDRIVYLVARPHEAPAALVQVDLEAAAETLGAEGIRVTGPRGGGSLDTSAARAAERVADTIRRRFADGGIRVTGRAPPPGDTPVVLSSGDQGAATASGPAVSSAPPRGTPRWLALVLLAGLALGLLFTVPRWLPPLLDVAGGRWWAAVGVVMVAQAALLVLLDDVVLHPNAHGWDLVRSLVGDATSPYPLFERYGALHVEVARILGVAAPPGRETFLASRIAGLLTTPALFALGAVALAPRAGLIACGLLAASPALLYAARGETVTTPVLLLAVSAAAAAAAAGRRRDLRLLAVAACAAAALASCRLMGPVLAPVAASFALLSATPGVQTPRRWGLALAMATLAAVGLAAPHLLQMGAMMTAELAARTHAGEVPNTLLTSPMFTPAALAVGGGAGIMLLALQRRLAAGLLLGWVALALWGPAASSGWYQDQARYQTLAVPALCLAAGWALHAALGLPSRRVAGAIALVSVAAFLPDHHLTGRIMATDQAETRQLQIWREVAAALPPDAWLAVPIRTASRARTSLPDTELRTARPDVRVVSIDEVLPRPDGSHPAGGRPVFWFQPLSCSARYPGEPEAVATDCVRADGQLVLRPVRSWAIDAELPADLSAALLERNVSGLFPTRGDPGQWNPRPFREGPLRVTLYSVAGFVGGWAAAGAGSLAAESVAAPASSAAASPDADDSPADD